MGKDRELPRGIYKRGRIYWICYGVGGGKMKHESTGSTQLRHAKTLLAKREEERFKSRHYPELARVERTLAEVVAHYLRHIRSADTLHLIEPRLEDALQFLGAETVLAEVTFEKLDAWAERLVEKRDLQPQSLKQYLVALAAAFRYGRRSRFSDLNPMADYELPKAKRKRKRVATDAEIDLILDFLSEHQKPEYRIHLRKAIVLAIETGMRRAEISALHTSWFDHRSRIIRIPPHVTKTEEGRSVPVTKAALSILAGCKDPIVAQKPDQITDKFTRSVKRLGIQDLHFHDLRHTRATTWIKAGVPEKVVQEILGHESVEMTRHYTNLTEGDLLDAVRRLESLH